jgi:tetratricopeptide (TPR) repeat protein
MSVVLRRLAFGLALFAAAACADTESIKDIKPGERPDIESDEAGYWMHMDEVEEYIQTSGRVVTDPKLNAYVWDLVCDLAGPYCRDIRVYILRFPAFNAAMAPNGSMQVWTGLLLRAENEAQLAFVIGHELGHYIKRHTLKRWRDIRAKTDAAVFIGFAGALAGIPMAGTLAQAGAFASIAAYSRDQEREADDIGFEMFQQIGYVPAEAARIWHLLIEDGEAGDWPEPPVFFASHPPTEERQETLARMADAREFDGVPSAYEERYLNATLPLRHVWLRDELRSRNFGSFEYLLGRLLESGNNFGELYFFQGEFYRLRDQEGDEQRAVEAYHQAVAYPDAPAETYRSLGLAQWSLGQTQEARASFEQYLNRAPDAEDRLMIEAHIEEL